MGIFDAVGSVVDWFEGNSAQKSANKISKQQLELQEEIARRQLDLASAGITNARGGVTSYDPVTNMWKVTPSGVERGLISASDTEQLKQLTNDTSIRRDQLNAQAGLAAKERMVASPYLEQLRQGSPYTPESIAAQYTTDALRGLREGTDNAMQSYNRQAVRSGDTGAGAFAAELAKRMGATASDTLRNARLQGLDVGNRLQSDFLNKNLSTYGALTGRDINTGTIPFSPIAENSDAALAGAQQAGSNSLQGASQSTAYGATLANQIAANNLANPYGYGSLITGIGDAIGAIKKPTSRLGNVGA